MRWAPPIAASTVGSFGDIATLSFYPAHHITMGEGGAVFTTRPLKPPLNRSATGAAIASARRARTTPAAAFRLEARRRCRTV